MTLRGLDGSRWCGGLLMRAGQVMASSSSSSSSSHRRTDHITRGAGRPGGVVSISTRPHTTPVAPAAVVRGPECREASPASCPAVQTSNIRRSLLSFSLSLSLSLSFSRWRWRDIAYRRRRRCHSPPPTGAAGCCCCCCRCRCNRSV